MPHATPPHDPFPSVHATVHFSSETPQERPTKQKVKNATEGWPIKYGNVQTTVYDVKFYPYAEPDEPPVFAVITAHEVHVCRPDADKDDPLHIIRTYRDPQPDASLNSVVWSQDVETTNALLCFGGASSGDIRIVDVVQDKYIRTLSGHGGAINDLAVSPLTPIILASASGDYTIRIWNLDPACAKHPCTAILAGPDAHKQPILTIAFHSLGRYILSAGTDAMINLWAVPEVPDRNSGTDKATRVYYPLFSSTEVHSDYVDCVRFYGDLILSHAASFSPNEPYHATNLVLWRIDGFDSAVKTLPTPPMTEPGVNTRSAFGDGFFRLATLDMPFTSPFYMRFSIFERPGYHAMLAMGNEKGRLSFWDMHVVTTSPEEPRKRKPKKASKRTAKAAIARSAVNRRSNVKDGDDTTEYDGGEVEDGKDSSDDNSVAPRAGANLGVPTNSHDHSDLSSRRSVSASTEPIRNRTSAVRRFMASTPSSDSGTTGSKAPESDDHVRYDGLDAFRPIPPHHTVATSTAKPFAVRQIAWSGCGKWCIGVGDLGTMVVLQRTLQPSTANGANGASGAGTG